MGGPSSHVRQQAPISQNSPNTTNALPLSRYRSMKSKRSIGTGSGRALKSHASKYCEMFTAFSTAKPRASSSLSQSARHFSLDAWWKYPGFPSSLSQAPHVLYSILCGSNTFAGVQSCGGKKKRRISKSNSTHSCTIQELPKKPSHASISCNRTANSSTPRKSYTNCPSQDHPTFTTPFFTPCLFTSASAAGWPRLADKAFCDQATFRASSACAAVSCWSHRKFSLLTDTAAGRHASGCDDKVTIHSLEVMSSYRSAGCGKLDRIPADSQALMAAKNADLST
mmetsp:Transcript_13837/g.39623  ORF Transcript_13837/g.39623 Transcript_13837/m.39623 type:complete len:282 (+) Transcript_13837:101-946(+)